MIARIKNNNYRNSSDNDNTNNNHSKSQLLGARRKGKREAKWDRGKVLPGYKIQEILRIVEFSKHFTFRYSFFLNKNQEFPINIMCQKHFLVLSNKEMNISGRQMHGENVARPVHQVS